MATSLTTEEILEELDRNSQEPLFSDSEGSSDLDKSISGDESSINTSSDDENVRYKLPPKKAKLTAPIWKTDPFVPTVLDFDNSCSGITSILNLTDNPTPSEIFLQQLQPDLAQHIVSETNKYYHQTLQKVTLSAKSKALKWKDLDVDELNVFLALCMLMSQTKKHTLESYWSTDPLIATPMFGKFMSLDRFKLILRFLHFNDNLTNSKEDREHKIRPIIDKLNNIFEKTMIPFRNLCIDESLVLFKGRLSFKQFIPSKRHRFGIKLFLLCDSETGYVLKIIVYTGKSTRVDELPGSQIGKSGEIVMELLKPYLGKGHCLFVDNWYSSPALFQLLLDSKTNACGTVKKNRKGLDKAIDKLNPGDRRTRHLNQVMHLTWQDKKPVNMLTTIHADTMIEIRLDKKQKTKNIPLCIQEYNQSMGAVDKADMMTSFVECARKSKKWYKKLFFHLLDVTLLNSFVAWEVISGEKRSLGNFQLELCRELLEKFGKVNELKKGGRPTTATNPARNIGHHYPSEIPSTFKTQKPSRQCVNCSKPNQRGRQSRYMCATCEVALCLSCFGKYHES